jgi:hypothetical protein
MRPRRETGGVLAGEAGGVLAGGAGGATLRRPLGGDDDVMTPQYTPIAPGAGSQS